MVQFSPDNKLGLGKVKKLIRESTVEHMILENSIIVKAKDQISCNLDGETVILNLKYGKYYGLNAVGFRIWNLLQEPKTVNEIRDYILSEYEVDLESFDRDLLTLIQQLLAANLIEVKE